MAWSSVYLHEYFGFTIYHPLTPLEQLILKQEFDKQPPWIHDFKALPNLAILLSYFCIGVALQLLRTPLIVYLIADLNATPAQVNVLFTVSKCICIYCHIDMCHGDLIHYSPFIHSFHHHHQQQWQSLGVSKSFMDSCRIVFPFMVRDENPTFIIGWLVFIGSNLLLGSHTLSEYTNVYLPRLYTNGRIHVE